MPSKNNGDHSHRISMSGVWPGLRGTADGSMKVILFCASCAFSVRQDTGFVLWNERSPPCNDPFGM